MLSFIVAVFLAWPTFGLSILVWLGYAWFVGRRKAQREARKAVLQPIFGDEFQQFFEELRVPYRQGRGMPDVDREKAGRLTMNCIAHHPDLFRMFMRGMVTASEGSPGLESAHVAVFSERYDGIGLVHLASLEALHVVAVANPGMRCFSAIDLDDLSSQIADIRSEVAGGGGA